MPGPVHAAADSTNQALALTAQPSTLEVGEEHRSQITAELKDAQGTVLNGAIIDFELSAGDGAQPGQLSATSAVTGQDGKARIEYLASRFAGTTIVTAKNKALPAIQQRVTITQKAGPVASVSLPLRTLSTDQDTKVNISLVDRFQNPVVDDTVVILSLTAKGMPQTESFRAQTKNGLAVINIPASVIKAKEYQAVASAGGIQSEIAMIKVGSITKLQDSGPTTYFTLLLALIGGISILGYRRLAVRAR